MPAFILCVVMYEMTNSVYFGFASYLVGFFVQYLMKRFEAVSNMQKFIQWTHRITVDLMHVLEMCGLAAGTNGISSSSYDFYAVYDSANEKLDKLFDETEKYYRFSSQKKLQPMIDLVLLVQYMAKLKSEGKRVPETFWGGDPREYLRQFLKGVRILLMELETERVTEDLDNIHNRLLKAVKMRKEVSMSLDGTSFVTLRDAALEDLNFLVPKYINGNDPALENIHSLRQDLM